MAKVHALEVFIGVVALFLVVSLVINRYTEVSVVESKEDRRMYIVRNMADKQKAADTLGKIANKMTDLVNHMMTIYPSNPDVKRLYKNFNPDNISESSDRDAYTSYSINKGEKIVLCIRSKKTKEIQEFNLLMYVAIHELAHLMTKELGHTEEFWTNNKLLLKEAIKIGIYERVDYSEKPAEYCGIQITSSVI